MTRPPAADPIEERILGGDRKLSLLAAQGLAPLPPDRLIALQVRLAGSEDSEVAEAARSALEDVDPRLAASALAGDLDVSTLAWFAANSEHPLVLETIARHRDVSIEVLHELAGRASGEIQDVLILRQDVIVEHPELLDALDGNPRLEDRIRRRVAELREHLVRVAAEPEPEVDEEPEGEERLVSRQEVAEAIEAAMDESIEGEIDHETGLSEGQIRTLPVPVRLQLARGAGRSLRDILIRDSNAQVATAVLAHNAFSDGDIERIAKMRNVAEDVLEAIGRDRRWVRRYPIALALVKNPRTPIPVAVGIVPRLAVRDLQLIRRDRNVSEAVRSRAQRLFSLKVG